MECINWLQLFIKKNAESIFRFLFVGLISAIIYLVSFNLLWLLIGLNYKLAITIAFTLSIIFHFFSNRHFTFKHKHKNIHYQFSKFLVMVAFNYALTLIITHYCVDVFTINPSFAIIISIGLTTMSNYFIAKCWVFPTTPLKLIKNEENN